MLGQRHRNRSPVLVNAHGNGAPEACPSRVGPRPPKRYSRRQGVALHDHHLSPAGIFSETAHPDIPNTEVGGDALGDTKEIVDTSAGRNPRFELVAGGDLPHPPDDG